MPLRAQPIVVAIHAFPALPVQTAWVEFGKSLDFAEIPDWEVYNNIMALAEGMEDVGLPGPSYQRHTTGRQADGRIEFASAEHTALDLGGVCA
jgi:hypothetical protein